MAERFDGGDESRVQALMAENSALRIDNENMYYAMGEVDRLRKVLEKIAKLDLPYRDTAARARHLARTALSA
jgi:cob(I)alamin adenosyltransferase